MRALNRSVRESARRDPSPSYRAALPGASRALGTRWGPRQLIS